MKRFGFVARIGAVIAAPFVPLGSKLAPKMLPDAGSVMAAHEEGVWLWFRRADGSTWGGIFRAMDTNASRLAELRSVGVTQVEWWKGGTMHAVHSLEDVITGWDAHIIDGLRSTWILPR